jgi:MinD superfamily P-loop ATPase
MTQKVRELVVVSGKGGTGKTSVVASFAALAGGAVLADCDVDASDLPLVLTPDVRRTDVFRSGNEALIRPADCNGCGECLTLCRFGAVRKRISASGNLEFSIDPLACEGCGVCVWFCPSRAIDFPERTCGEWYVSTTRFGPMVHARLGIAAENSGKLVTLVRREARRIAEETGSDWLLVDGPPGIGCPVIASITGASQVLIVTEPTLSGRHDMERVVSLCRHFGIPVHVSVNKWDLNPSQADDIEHIAVSTGAGIAGRVRYDRAFTEAQMQLRTVVEEGGGAAEDIRKLWNGLKGEQAIENSGTR